MNTKQHTIKETTQISGVGLHTGVPATMTFVPAEANHGVKFQRIDLEGEPIVEADVDNVVDLSRGTTIEKNGARVNTVEHTLAAISGLEIDNILIQLDGPEPPIMDGSSIEFVKILKEAGTVEQKAVRQFYEIDEYINYKDEKNNIEISASPLNNYRLTVLVDYNSPVLGSQHATLNDIKDFAEEVASSRTFCFLHELEMLYKNNLIQGGALDNAIVIVDRVVKPEEIAYLTGLFNQPTVEVKEEGILNNVELRHKNEPARHKLLDLVGDLVLAGKPIKGQILAARPGHAANVAFAKKIKRHMEKKGRVKVPQYDPTQEALMDVKHIANLLPHRYPFALVDKVIYLDDKVVSGIKNVTLNEPFFEGHFPNNPVMPGVLQVEAMAQTGGILVLSTVPDPENYWAYLLSIEKCRFRRMVLPGDTLIFRCELLYPIKRGIARMRGEAFVGNNLVCEAELSASIVRKENAK